MKTQAPLLALALALAPACAKTNADNIKPVSEPATPTAASSAEPAAAGTRSYTVSGIYLDPELARTCGLTPPKAFFEYDSAAVEGADNGHLTALATCMSTGPLKGRSLELVGHADPRGTDEYNQQLGMTRADAVLQFLSTQGVPADQMKSRSEGETGADPKNAEEWPYDRRVDIRIAP